MKTIKKQKSVAKLVKDLDKIFSVFIRIRNADENGMVTCFTSGKVMHWKKSQAGHFISRRKYPTRWDDINTQVQSVSENVFNQGNAPVFAINLDKKYGPGTSESLVMKSHNKMKLERFTLNYLIGEYNNRVTNIAKEKGIEL